MTQPTPTNPSSPAKPLTVDATRPATQPRTYAIIGSGALGGLYGAKLAAAGHTVHFLMHSDVQHVRDHGLRVESVWGDVQLEQVHVHADAAEMPACDVTIVGLKTTQNSLLADLLPPPTRRGGTVLVLQNGLGIESATSDVVGRDRTYSGCCFLCSNKVGPGHIRHLDQGRIVLGHVDGPADMIASGIVDDLNHAGVPAKSTDSMRQTRWRKLLWNIPFNGLSVVLDASTTELMGCPATVQLATDLVDEVAAAAGRVGIDIPDEHKRQTIDATRKMVPYDSSMRLDYKAGRPMEIAAIFDAPIEAAGKLNFLMPRTTMLRDLLRYRDNRQA